MGPAFRGIYGGSFLRVRVVKQRVISAPFLLSGIIASRRDIEARSDEDGKETEGVPF